MSFDTMKTTAIALCALLGALSHPSCAAQSVAIALDATAPAPANFSEKVAADLDLARTWKPGTLKNDGPEIGRAHV